MTSKIYDLNPESITEFGMKFFFISKGVQDIVKAIQFHYVSDLNDKRLYNLGFGDYDLEKDIIKDDINTDNGDVYKVFNTVLNTIPSFFESFPGSIMAVQGSDSKSGFDEICRKSCNKKCNDLCKKKDQRIRLYCGYVSREHLTLSKTYSFYGGYIKDYGTVIEDFIINKKYDLVFVTEKYT